MFHKTNMSASGYRATEIKFQSTLWQNLITYPQNTFWPKCPIYHHSLYVEYVATYSKQQYLQTIAKKLERIEWKSKTSQNIIVSIVITITVLLVLLYLKFLLISFLPSPPFLLGYYNKMCHWRSVLSYSRY